MIYNYLMNTTQSTKSETEIALSAFYAAKADVATLRGSELRQARADLKRAKARCKALGIDVAGPKKNTQYKRVNMRG